MNWYPISFTGWSVQQILARLKGQTRRLIRLTKAGNDFKSPYGVKGDRLWVRETWQWDDFVKGPLYRADYEPDEIVGEWKPPMFMPRKFSRITLVNEGERIERVKEIQGYDVTREGIGDGGCADDYAEDYDAFARLWDSIYGKKPGGSWDENPRVRVLAFRLEEETT